MKPDETICECATHFFLAESMVVVKIAILVLSLNHSTEVRRTYARDLMKPDETI